MIVFSRYSIFVDSSGLESRTLPAAGSPDNPREGRLLHVDTDLFFVVHFYFKLA
jgi:hypothetical protein